MFPRLVISAVVVLVLGASVPVMAGAQEGRLAEELAITDRRIELAEGIVGASSEPLAQQELAAAVDFQRRARNAAGASQPLVGLRLTREARAHADRAIAIVRGLPDPDRVVTQVERTRELIDQSRERVEGCDDARARSLVRVAVEMQNRAENALHDSRYLAALQLTMSAREKFYQALRKCRLEESAESGANRALARTDEVIARARTEVDAHPSEPARLALSRAAAVQSDAQSEFRAGRYESCLRMTQAARAMAHRATRLASDRPR